MMMKATADAPRSVTPSREAEHRVSPERTAAAWDGIAAGYEEFVTPTHLGLADEGLRRVGLRSGMRFLDVAAGSGALSIPAARLGSHVLATDLSPGMLDQLAARARREGLENVTTRVMDGHALELEDATFDIVGSQFGVMLFPDMPRALSEMARVTKPGGRVLMHVFGAPERVEFLAFFLRAITAVVPGFPGLPSDPPPLEFQLRDPERLRRELTGAGLKGVSVETVTERMEFRSGRELWDWLVHSNPIVRRILSQLAVTDDQTAAIRTTLAEEIHQRAEESGVAVLTSPVNIGIGTK